MLAPIQIKGHIHLVNENGDTAEVTFGFKPGVPVDVEDIEKAVREAAKAGEEAGFKLMTPSTFFNHVLIPEKTGQKPRSDFATPATFEYEAFGLPMLAIESPHVDDDELGDDD